MTKQFPGRILLAAAALAISVAAPRGEAPAPGRITGRVRLTAHPAGLPLAIDPYPSRGVARQVVPATPEIKNVVVYLKDAPYRGELPVATHEMRQEHETFVPHVLAVTRGSTVEFPNADPFFHNVFSLSSALTFDLGRYPRGQTRSRRFPRAGLVKVYCHIHSHMTASILVLDHPYFAIPAVDGSFEIAGVPAGQYTIVGWHERVGEQSRPVQVQAGRAAAVELTVPVEDAR